MATLNFYGGVGMVTGANFLLETDDLKILVDCGLVQDRRICHGCNYKNFPYALEEIDILFVTHAHLDHIGRIPKLVHDGFKGIIYSTPSTREIATIMFDDGVGILSREAKREGREPLYDKEDVVDTLKLWKDIPYHTKTDIGPGYSVYFKDAGHIMGSAMVEITHMRAGESRKIVFTGDLGNSPTPLLRDTEDVEDANYMVMESVYGDRNHENSMKERTDALKRVISDAAKRGATLLIPAFSIERTQIILHEINHLVEDKKIPSLPVFLDSPLAIKVTEIYKKYQKNLKGHVQQDIKQGDDIFDFPKLELTRTKRESREINNHQGPKIIIAGSGMSYGGRIMFHERIYLKDPNNVILFVGYQVPGTVGRQIQDGNKVVDIFGKKVRIKARIETISGFSAHKDSDHLIEFASKSQETLDKLFVAMGEPKSSMFLAQRLKDYYGINAIVPKQDESFEIDF